MLTGLVIPGAGGQERPQRFLSLKFETSLTIDVGEISEMLPFLAGGRGRIDFKGTVEARGETLHYKGRIEGEGLTWEGYPPIALRANVEGDRERLRVSDLVLEVPGGRLEGEAVVSPPGAGTTTVSIRWEGLDLRPLTAAIETIPVVAAASTDGRLEATWTEPSAAAVRGSLRASFRPLPVAATNSTPPLPVSAADQARPLRVPTAGQAQPLPVPATAANRARPALPFAGEIEARGAEGGLEIVKSSLRLAGAQISLSGRYGANGRINGRYSLAIPDAAATLRTIKALPLPLPESLAKLPQDDLSGRVEVSGTVSGTPDSPTLAADLQGAARYRDFAVEAMSASLRWANGRLSLPSLRVEAGGGLLEGQGRYLVQPRGRRPSPEDQLTLSLSGFEIGTLAPLLLERLAAEIGGRLNAQAVISGTPDRPEAAVTIEAAALSASGANLDRLAARARLAADGSITVEELRLVAGEDVISGRAAVGPDRATIEASLQADNFDLSRLAPPLPQGTPLEGRVSFDLSAAGPIRRPVFKLDLRAADVAVERLLIPVLQLTAESDGRTAAATLTTGDLGLRAEARMSFEPPYLLTGTIAADQLNLEPFIRTPDRSDKAAAASLPSPEEIKATAKPRPDEKAASAIPRPDKTAAPALPRPEIPTATVLPRPDEAAAPTSAAALPLTLKGNFSYPLENPSAFEAHLSLSGLDFSALAALSANPQLEGLTGEMAASLAVNGNPREPAALRADLEIATLALGWRGIDVRAPAPWRITLRDGDLTLGDVRLEADESSLSLAGFVRWLGAAPVLDLELAADLNAALIPPDLFEAGDLAGRLTAKVTADGPLANPQLGGTASLSGGYVALTQIPLTLNNVAAQLEFQGDTIRITEGLGTANGGYLSFSGEAGIGGEPFGLTGAKLDLRAGGVRLDYPQGLVTVLSADTSVSSEDGQTWLISGQVDVLRGAFREDVFPGAEILGFSSLPLPPPSAAETPPFYENLRLDLHVRTQQPLLVRNNIADLELTADLRVGGTLADPRLDGRILSAGVGSLVFNEREFTVERVEVEYAGVGPSEPRVEIVAHTELTLDLNELDVTLRLTGTPPDLDVGLTSSPPAAREELAFALLTGRSLRSLEGAPLNTLGSQLVTWFAAPLASPVTRALERLLGFERISLEPLNVVSEEDPGARLTLRKRLSERAAVTYSLDITSSQGQIWIADYDLFRNFSLRAVRDEDGSFGGSLRHGFSLFGPPPDPATAAAAGPTPVRDDRVTALEVTGDPGPLAEAVQRRLDEAGAGERRFTIAGVGRLSDDLQNLYTSRDYYNATVLTRIEETEGGTRAVFEIRSGRPVRFAFRGDNLPGGIEREVRAQWTGLMPESVNLDTGRETILDALRQRRHYDAGVEIETVREGGLTVYTFVTAAGPRYKIRSFEVRGNDSVPDNVIRDAVTDIPTAQSPGLWTLVNETDLAVRAVELAYENRGFREAEVSQPEIAADPARRSLAIALRVTEGPQSLIRVIAFTGNEAFPETELRARAALAPGDPFAPTRVRDARLALVGAYRDAGYQDAEISVEARQPADGTDVTIVFEIREGDRHTVEAIEIETAGRTSRSFIRRTVGLEPGMPLSSADLAQARNRLYDTGVFSDVDVRGEAGPEGREMVTVAVRPEPPVRVNYGLRYNTEDGFEGIGEFDLVNLFGTGRRGVFAFRSNTRETDLRLTLSSPYLFGARLNLLGTAASTREIRETFTTEERRLSLGARLGLPFDLSLSGLYRARRIHLFEAETIGPFPFDFTIDLAELTGQLVRDDRDDRFDPRRGTFVSLSATYAPEFLGTELRYLSTYSQLAFYVPFGPDLVWASSWQAGLAGAFDDQVLVSFLRFFAGGAYSLRGFRQDEVGPMGFTGPEGGEAVLLTSQELRFPIIWGLRGAVFFDAGNVYDTISDITLSDLRTGLGGGLRYNSPVGLLRFDLGFNLAPRESEPRAVAYFSLGQAF